VLFLAVDPCKIAGAALDHPGQQPRTKFPAI
jgi:hypothetical protein